MEGGSGYHGQHLGSRYHANHSVLVKKLKSLLQTSPLDPRLYGVCLKLAGLLAHKFGRSFLPEGCHPFQPVLGWDVLGIAHMFNGHP